MKKYQEVAFNDGINAGKSGLLEGMNPYQISDEEYSIWSSGWAKGNSQRVSS
jgi:ribosome modulation factor